VKNLIILYLYHDFDIIGKLTPDLWLLIAIILITKRNFNFKLGFLVLLRCLNWFYCIFK